MNLREFDEKRGCRSEKRFLETRSIAVKKMYQAKVKRNRRGFSLLELLAVVVILGIIAAIVVPRVSTSSTLAKQRVHEHNIATLNSAVERYFVTEGNWPSALTDLGVDYLPDGVPAVPTNNSLTYSIDGTTHRVIAN